MGGARLGKAYGAHVTGLTRSDHLDLERDPGADEALDRRTTTPVDLGRFDVVLDTVGTGLAADRGPSSSGRMVTVSFDTGPGAAPAGLHRRFDGVRTSPGPVLQWKAVP